MLKASSLIVGAPDKIWTCTIAHTPLKRARLPVPPLVHKNIVLIIESICQ